MAEKDDTLASPENKLTQEEAERKVAEMFAAASAARKAPKKNRRSDDAAAGAEDTSDEQPSALLAAAKAAPKLFRDRIKSEDISDADEPKLSHREAEKKIAEILANTDTSGSKNDSSVNSGETLSAAEQSENTLTPQEAEEKIAEIFALAGNSQKNSKKMSGISGIAYELTVLELLSFSLFLASMASGGPGPFTLIAILLPVIVGVGDRVLRKQYSLLEALSKCKPHIILSALFYICLLLSV